MAAVSNVHMYISIKNRGCSFRWSGSYFYLPSHVNCLFLHMNNCDMIVNIPSSMQDPRAVQVWRIEVAASDDECFYLLSLVCPRQPSALARPQPTKLLPPDNHGLICQLVIGQLGPEICLPIAIIPDGGLPLNLLSSLDYCSLWPVGSGGSFVCNPQSAFAEKLIEQKNNLRNVT